MQKSESTPSGTVTKGMTREELKRRLAALREGLSADADKEKRP